MHQQERHTRQMLQPDMNMQTPKVSFRAQGATVPTLDMTAGSYTNNMRVGPSLQLGEFIAPPRCCLDQAVMHPASVLSRMHIFMTLQGRQMTECAQVNINTSKRHQAMQEDQIAHHRTT